MSTTWELSAAGAKPRFGALRHYRYTAAVTLLAVAAIVALSGTSMTMDQAFVPLSCALAVGLLLTVRLAPGHPGAALAVVPAIAVDARLGLSVLPALLFAALVANYVRGVRGPSVVASASHAVLAFAAGHLVAELATNQLPISPAWLVFALVFSSVRLVLWFVAQRFALIPNHARTEQPDVLLSLALAPVGLLPLLAGERLGDGALLLAMAALLALLFVVREAANLATLRAETEAERDRLMRANDLQDDLINMITHELRNPLTLVMSYAQMTRRSALDGNVEAIPSYIGNVERAGRSIQRLMENLLQLTKLERSDSLPTAEPVQLASIVNQVIVDLAPLAKQKEQTLVVEPIKHVEPALAVPLLLRDALSNLLSNAVKYTPEGGEITVWAERGKRSGTVVLGVRDTGIGLSEDDLQRLFTKFFRSSDARVQRERGSGLGLALTHTMVRRMGGSIEVDSTLGTGTTFRLTLPAARTA
jgi:signal transduction histidine kinase